MPGTPRLLPGRDCPSLDRRQSRACFSSAEAKLFVCNSWEGAMAPSVIAVLIADLDDDAVSELRDAASDVIRN